ncbi:MAG: transcriptional regulator [Lachnospiraceae bacterium]|nr:transcriptional regulator [Lachnospiraceae bacterium]
MENIKQTNRTILFEEFNAQKPDLITMVGDVNSIESLTDAQIKEINDKLLVKDFDDFLTKFEPVVYSYFNAANQKVMYTLEKPDNIPQEYISEIYLNKRNDFLNMLFTLIEAKRSQGTINVDFKFESILDMISPKKIMDDIKQVRKEINFLYDKHEALEDGDPTKLEIADKLNYKFEEASQNYNNVMAMLPLAMEDIKTRLLFTKSSETTDAAPLKIGVLSMSETGELKVLEASTEKRTELAQIAENTSVGLIETFKEDYDAVVQDEPSDYVRNLVVRTFCPLTAVIDNQIDVEAEAEKYNTYLEFYKEAKDEFVKTVKPLVEKILGVKMFFEQYNTKEKGMNPTLLITNATLEMTTKSINLPRVETYLNTVNSKNDYSNTVWLAIVPEIDLDASGKVVVKRQRFQGTAKSAVSSGNTLESLTAIMQTLMKNKVQTFFNFKSDEETNFNYVATQGVDKFIDKCEMLKNKEYSEYLSCCLPNFTIIPKEKSGVLIDNKITINSEGGAELSKAREDIMKLWLEGVFVGASYVAAGMVAAWQSPEYLRTIFKNTTPKYPGVRFDIESGENALMLCTTMAHEITGFTNTIKNAINSKGFGFVFSSENAQCQGKDIKNITVYKARSLAMGDNNNFESIYKTMAATYIERILRYMSNDFKQDNVVKFFSNNPASQKSVWIADKNFVNSIVQDGDDIGYSIDDETNVCNINLVFNGNVKNLEIEITKATSAM